MILADEETAEFSRLKVEEKLWAVEYLEAYLEEHWPRIAYKNSGGWF